MDRINKRFGSIVVLDDVSLELFPGEVHALLGCNGAGKSTLLKVLGGVFSANAGTVSLEGKTITPRSPAHANHLGIAVIHQELSLIPSLSITENLLLGRPMSRWGFIQRQKEETFARKRLAQVGLDLDPRTLVEELTLAEKQLVEIAKALGVGAKVLVMDEPTSALTGPSIERLFDLLRSLCARGVAIVYVSHRMEEITRVAQRLTVLRDGRVVGKALVADTQLDEVVSWMLGPRASIQTEDSVHQKNVGTTCLDVRDFSVLAEHTSRKVVDGISLAVHHGEIAGVFGLSGSGSSDLIAGLFGVFGGRASGSVKLDGTDVHIKHPREAAALGLGFVPADRKTQGIVPLLSSAHNATLALLSAQQPWGFIQRSNDREMANDAARQTRLAPEALSKAIGELSGGNQQKVVLGKWLISQPRLLLLDEPTRGVDVGAKSEMYGHLRMLVGRGASVLVASSDAEELVGICDRIFVFVRGKITATIDRQNASAERLLALAMGAEVHEARA